MIKDLILAGLLACVMPLYAAAQNSNANSADAAAVEPPVEVVEEPAESAMSAEEFLASLNFQRGKIVLGDNLATLNLPDDLVFLDGADAERVLVDAWGNPPRDEPTLGMLMLADVSPLDQGSWAVTIEFEDSGYVSDEDAADIDYTQMLEDMQADMVESNEWRKENGYEQVALLGWAAKPHYDAASKKLYWAKELKFGDDPNHTLNYNIRVLGRKGVLVLNFIAGMEQLPDVERKAPEVLAMTEFNQGSRYADFDPDLDEVAAYGIGALIAGKVAAKAGLLAGALLLLKKLWILPVLFFGWLFKRLRAKKNS